MGQINISCEDKLIRDIDRVAAARGLRRADLLRAAMVEAIEAFDAGRLAFHSDDQPRIDITLSALAIRLQEAVVELDRSQRSNLKLEKRLLDAHVASETAVQAAQEQILARVNDVNRKSYEPFVARLGELRNVIEAIGDRLADEQQNKLQIIADHLDTVCKEARTPRTEQYLVLTDDKQLTVRVVAWSVAVIAVLPLAAFLLILPQVQWLARPLSAYLIATDEHFCRVVNDVYAVTDCVVPQDNRALALRAIEAADQ